MNCLGVMNTVTVGKNEQACRPKKHKLPCLELLSECQSGALLKIDGRPKCLAQLNLEKGNTKNYPTAFVL